MQLDLFAPRTETVFVRHRWARRYILRVLDNGTLRVTLPKWGSKREAVAFVESSSAWIARQLLKQQEAARHLREDGILLDGGILRNGGTLGNGGTFVPPFSPDRAPELRKQAVKELPPQLLALADRHDITVSKVSIRNQRSRWGACSSSGSITLNWRLVLVPDFVREYVMIHELMHRREMNHSKRFWKHVAAACPRYQEARQWLLKNGPHLFTGSGDTGRADTGRAAL